jgi:ribosomal protein L17
MIYGRKMMLVSPEEGEVMRTQSQPAPQQREQTQALALEPVDSILTLDTEMQRILTLPIKSDFEKWSMYKQVLQKFVNKLREKRVSDDKTEPQEIQSSETVEQPTREEVPRHVDENAGYNRILADSFVRETDKTKARVLINILKRAEGVKWDDTGRIFVRDHLLKSSLHQLVHSTLRPSRTRPHGWDEFQALLTKLNVPATYLKSLKTEPTRKKHGSVLSKWRPY